MKLARSLKCVERNDEGPPGPGSGTGTTNGGGGIPQIQSSSYSTSTNYEDYTNFYLTSAITNTNQMAVSLLSTLPGLTYQVWTNSQLSISNGWALTVATTDPAANLAGIRIKYTLNPSGLALTQ